MSVLEIEGLSKHFGGIVVADDISLTIDRGEILGLIGPNGAGKTSLFNLIAGVVPPDRGRIVLNGRAIETLPMYARARLGISRTWQHIRLFPSLTAVENVILGAQDYQGENPLASLAIGSRGRRRAERTAALATLARVGLEDAADRLPGELSFGRQKLVALARALMNGGDCLLLDEPMAGVEGRVYDTIRDVIKGEAQRGRAVCAVEHDIAFVKDLCPQAVFMFNGRMVAKGTIEQLLSQRELADLYFGEVE